MGRGEGDSLALAKHPENRALERVGGQVEFAEIRVPQDDSVAGCGIVCLDHTLHRGHRTTGNL